MPRLRLTQQRIKAEKWKNESLLISSSCNVVLYFPPFIGYNACWRRSTLRLQQAQGQLYNLKHMEQLEHLSFKGQKALFNRLEELARIANMNKKERAEYEAALKIYRDNENVVTTARREGKEEGIAIGEERGVLKTARLMKQNGASVEFIKQCTGMTEEEIKNL